MLKLKKEQIELTVISVLVVVAIIIAIGKFRKKDKDMDVEMKDFSEKDSIAKWEEVHLLEEQMPAEEVVISYADIERIPFEGPFEGWEEIEVVEEDIELPPVSLQGIIWSSIRPQIIINNIVYGVNDTVDIEGADGKVKLKDIKKDGVYFEYKGKEFIVNPGGSK